MKWIIMIAIVLSSIYPMSVDAAVDVDMYLNNGGFTSFDHFKAELILENQGATIPDAQIFGILDIFYEYFFWPGYSQDPDFEIHSIGPGIMTIPMLEFDFPNIDDTIPFGPLRFWGAWYVDAEDFGYDMTEFWLDDQHKWPTPTPTPPLSTPTPTFTPGGTNAGDLYAIDEIVGNLRYVPATGAQGFLQGSPEDEPCIGENEAPFTHILTRNIAVMETEITRQMWADLQAVQPSLPNDPTKVNFGGSPNHPVQKNTWYECILFANLLSQDNGLTPCYYYDASFTIVVDALNYENDNLFCNFDADGYRLPSEGEWEYACRADTTGPFSCDEPGYTVATCAEEYCVRGEFPVYELYSVFCANENGGSEPVGSKLPNPWNIVDMHGNESEWCWDWFDPVYPTDVQTDYTGPETGTQRQLRGGGWSSHARFSRSGHRYAWDPNGRFNSLGFRLVRSLEP